MIDDESDYFATDSNQWLTTKQRSALRSREAELYAKRHAARHDRSRQVTLDFAGRRIVEENDELVVASEDDVVGDITAAPAQFNPDDFNVDLVNPHIKLSAPPQVCVIRLPALRCSGQAYVFAVIECLLS